MPDESNPPGATPTPVTIGPYYKIMGAVALVGAVVIAVISALHGSPVTKMTVVVYAILALLCLALIRPPIFDGLVKTVVDKLPFTKYVKPE